MKFADLKILYSREKENARKTAPKNSISFVIAAYNRVIKVMSSYYKDSENVTISKIDELPITEHMKIKLNKLSKKPVPKSRDLKDAQNLEKLKLDLANLLGIGNAKARQLIDMGLKNINQITQKKYYDTLNSDTKLMIEYKPLRKIPHDDIKKIEVKLTAFPDALVELVGSFRRKRPFSKDIDILIRAENSIILDKYLKYLNRKFNNAVYLYSHGVDRISLIIQPFDNRPNLTYKLDIFRTGKDTYYSHLLYSTGPKEFNIKTRSRARKLGFLLNQNGLFEKVRNNTIKINSPIDDEAKILSYLGLPYLRPEDRY